MEITAQKIKRALREPSYLVEVGKRRLENFGLIQEDACELAQPPRALTVFLTSVCNLRCRMCPQYGEEGTSFVIPRTIPDKEILLRTAKELAPYGTRFSFMGGEPTLNPEWSDIIRQISDLGLPCEIITNGTSLHGNAKRFVDSGLDVLNLSCDGIGEVNDQIRGEGVFKKIEKGLDALIEYKKQVGRGRPIIQMLFTINQPNYRHLVEHAEWVASKEVDNLTFIHLRFHSEEIYLQQNEMMEHHLGVRNDGQAGFVFDPGLFDIEVLRDQIQQVKSRKWPFNLRFQPDHSMEEIEDYYNDPDYKRRNLYDCVVPWQTAAIDVYCNVMPCLDFNCGSLKEKSFLDIWNGEKYVEFRRFIRENGRTPLCHRCCV